MILGDSLADTFIIIDSRLAVVELENVEVCFLHISQLDWIRAYLPIRHLLPPDRDHHQSRMYLFLLKPNFSRYKTIKKPNYCDCFM